MLVLDIGRQSRSVAAIAAGMAAYDPSIDVVGVILNSAGSARNVAEIEQALTLPVLGVLPRDEELATPSRHLGLVPAAERDESVAMVERLGGQVAKHLDLDALLAVARSAPDLDGAPWDPAAEMARGPGSARRSPSPGGRAFTFRYPETEELLRAAGCEVVTFDPLRDRALPAGHARDLPRRRVPRGVRRRAGRQPEPARRPGRRGRRRRPDGRGVRRAALPRRDPRRRRDGRRRPDRRRDGRSD